MLLYFGILKKESMIPLLSSEGYIYIFLRRHIEKMKDYYRIIGVPSTASMEEIKKNFHLKMRICHPDTNSKDPDVQQIATEMAKELTEAFEVLKDPVKKLDYDLQRNHHSSNDAADSSKWEETRKQAEERARQEREYSEKRRQEAERKGAEDNRREKEYKTCDESPHSQDTGEQRAQSGSKASDEVVAKTNKKTFTMAIIIGFIVLIILLSKGNNGPKPESISLSNYPTSTEIKASLQTEIPQQVFDGLISIKPNFEPVIEIYDSLGNNLSTLDFSVSCEVISNYQWSPDGQWIAFYCDDTLSVSDRSGQNIKKIYVEPDYSNNNMANGITWSPDSEEIMFTSSFNVYDEGCNIDQHEIGVINRDGTDLQRMTFSCENGNEYQSVSWSPNGKQIFMEMNFSFVVMNLDGTQSHNITYVGQAPIEGSWSPDGNSIVYLLKENDSAKICISDKDFTKSSCTPIQLFSSTGYSEVKWSTDGNWLLFSNCDASNRNHLCVVSSDFSSGQIPLENLPFGEVRWLP